MNRLIEWFLNLSPGRLAEGKWQLGFIAEHNNYVWLALIVAAGLLVSLGIYCYRRDGDLASRTRRWLLGLRLAAILLVFLILFQPAVILRVTETLYSSVLILIDESMSMSFHDSYRGADKATVETRKKISDTIAVDEGELKNLSRQEILLKSLLRPGGPLELINRDHPIELIGFSTDQPGRATYTRVIDSIPRATLPAGQADVANQSGLLDSILTGVQGKGYETNHALALREGLDRFPGRRLGAVVMLSDGQPTNPDAAGRLGPAVTYAEQHCATRQAVMFGDPRPPKNLRVVSLHGPREIREKTPATFSAKLSHRNMKDIDVPVRLYQRKIDEPWPADMSKLTPVATTNVQLVTEEDDENSQSVEISFVPEAQESGEYVYRAVADSQAGEESEEDNFAETFVRVSDSKIRILLISGDSGWELRYLQNYFLRQPESYSLSVWQQNTDAAVTQKASPGMELKRLPRSLSELIGSNSNRSLATQPTTQPAGESVPPVPPGGYDVVILYDPVPTAEGFDAKFINLLHDFVTIHRGGLCYIASRRNSFDILRDPAAKALADLLPVKISQNKVNIAEIINETRPQPWPVRLTSYGVDHEITRLLPKADENRNIWNVLPGIFWSQAVARKKPAARVLAENSNPARVTDLRSEPEPLLVVHSAGSGRVVYVGFDETWRWRFVADGLYHRRLWGNLVRYLAPQSPRQVVISTGGDRFDTGDKIKIEVEAFDREYKPLQAESFKVRMIDTTTGQAQEHKLSAVAGKPGQYQGIIQADRTGTFELTCEKSIADRSKVAGRTIVVELPQAEARRTEADDRLLKTIASRPEFFMQAGDIEKLPSFIPPGLLTTVHENRFTLWDTKLTLMLIIALLTAEWILRKRNNLM